MVQKQQIEGAQQQAKKAIQLFSQQRDLSERFIEVLWEKVDQETTIKNAAVLAGIVLVRELGTWRRPGSILFENAFLFLVDFLAEHFDRSADEIRTRLGEDT